VSATVKNADTPIADSGRTKEWVSQVLGKGHRLIRNEGKLSAIRVVVNPEYRFTIPESIREICDIKAGAVLEFEVPKGRDEFTVHVLVK
jgi:hypothetical protein